MKNSPMAMSMVQEDIITTKLLVKASPSLSLYWILGLLFWSISSVAWAQRPTVIVYAAVSTRDVLQTIFTQYQQQFPVRIQSAFGDSATLAQQIVQGAPAHIFVSAHPRWMDYLEHKELVVKSSRFDWLANRLVIIAPATSSWQIQWNSTFDLSHAFAGKWVTAQPSHVPLGIYAQEALQYYGWWEALKPRLVATENARMALVFVERGEVDMGIVYATDARLAKQIRLVGEFPAHTYSPIIYPATVLVSQDTAEAQRLLQFFRTPTATEILSNYGFEKAPPHD